MDSRGRHAVAATVEPADRLVPDSVEWLSDGELSYRLRFALRLEPGEHVVGFGERFDALDQRGRRVDSAVFEQYKGQGARSYLPMPFAIVVGGDFGLPRRHGSPRAGSTSAHPIRICCVIEVDLEPGDARPGDRAAPVRGRARRRCSRAFADGSGDRRRPTGSSGSG